MSDDESIGEFCNGVNSARKAKRADNRAFSLAALKTAVVDCSTKNGGDHLVVPIRGHTIDFWTGTGLWIMRGSTKRHRGVSSLIKFVNDLK